MNILSALLIGRTPQNKAYYTQAHGILSANSARRLNQWGKRVSENPGVDPAKELLRTLIFADAPSILTELISPDGRLVSAVFYEFPLAGKIRSMGAAKFADYIDIENTTYDDEGMPCDKFSTAVAHLANYIRGDLLNPTPLLHALTERIWRDADADTYEAMLSTTFLFHTYLFYVKGFRSDRGIQRDRLAHLTGRTIPTASQKDWDNFRFQQYAGHPAFGILPMVDTTRIRDDFPYPHVIHHAICGDVITFYDFGDTGLAIKAHMDGRNLMYFLHLPDEYDEPIQQFFYPPIEGWGGDGAMDTASVSSMETEDEGWDSA